MRKIQESSKNLLFYKQISRIINKPLVLQAKQAKQATQAKQAKQAKQATQAKQAKQTKQANASQ